MVVGIDLDNIVVNTTETVLNYLAERGAPKLTLEDIKDYWLEKSFPPEYSLLVKEAFESKHMWKQVRLIDGAYTYIKNSMKMVMKSGLLPAHCLRILTRK